MIRLTKELFFGLVTSGAEEESKLSVISQRHSHFRERKKLVGVWQVFFPLAFICVSICCCVPSWVCNSDCYGILTTGMPLFVQKREVFLLFCFLFSSSYFGDTPKRS